MEILRIAHILYKNETDTKRNQAKKQCPVKKHLPNFDKWTKHQCLHFSFSFHFNKSYTLSRIKYSTDMNSDHPGLKWPTTQKSWDAPAGCLLNKHTHIPHPQLTMSKAPPGWLLLQSPHSSTQSDSTVPGVYLPPIFAMDSGPISWFSNSLSACRNFVFGCRTPCMRGGSLKLQNSAIIGIYLQKIH